MKNLDKFYRTPDETPPKLGNGSPLIAVAPMTIPATRGACIPMKKVLRQFPNVN